jgi:hypothetical protein
MFLGGAINHNNFYFPILLEKIVAIGGTPQNKS